MPQSSPLPPRVTIAWPSLWGTFRFQLTESGVAALELPCGGFALRNGMPAAFDQTPKAIRRHAKQLIQWLTAYLGGEKLFSPPPFDYRATNFQQTVWSEMRRIPLGQTLSYGGLAQKIGRPSAPRAVGMACRTNPIPLLIPCHRVIGSKGQLVGFSTPGGLVIKERLLAWECTNRAEPAPTHLFACPR